LMLGKATAATRCERGYQASLPAAPWGRDWTSPVHLVRCGVDSACASRAARHTSDPVGALRVQHVGLAATMKLWGEVGRRWWSHFWCGRCLIEPLSVSFGPHRARGGVRAAPVGALHELCSADGVNLDQMVI
jgi:hypothetical protein